MEGLLNVYAYSDLWQVMASIAGVAFTLSLIGQCRVTFRTRCVEGLSLAQWVISSVASSMFVAYYAHLEQWIMVTEAVFGTGCCLAVTLMIMTYSNRTA